MRYIITVLTITLLATSASADFADPYQPKELGAKAKSVGEVARSVGFAKSLGGITHFAGDPYTHVAGSPSPQAKPAKPAGKRYHGVGTPAKPAKPAKPAGKRYRSVGQAFR